MRKAFARAFVSLLLMSTTANPATADDAAPDSILSDSPLPSTYEASMSEARTMALNGRWASASDLYRHAFDLRPTTDAGLGELECALQLREYLRARELAQTVRTRFARQLTRKEKALLSSREALVAQKIAYLEFEVGRPSATVTVDGVRWTGQSGYVAPGTHVFMVEDFEFRHVEGQLQVTGGDRRKLTFAMQPTTNNGRADERLLDVAVPPARVVETQGGLKWTWVALGSTVLCSAAAIVLYEIAQAELDEIEASCQSEACSPVDARQAINASPGETYETLANVSIGLGIASAVTAVVLLVVEWPREAPGSGISRLELSPTGVRLGGHF